MTKRQFWTAREERILRDLYPDCLAETVAREIGRPVRAIYQKAGALGLSKSEDFNARDLSGRIQRGKQHASMVAAQFKPGLTPWNKGRKGLVHAGSVATQFQPGRHASEASNYQPLGTIRVCRDGLLERKVTDDPSIAPARRWVAVHRLVWEAANGPIPHGHAVVFRPGMRTAVLHEITAERVELVSRAELMRRNSYHTNYPPEVRQLVQLRGALTRQINSRTRALEQP